MLVFVGFAFERAGRWWVISFSFVFAVCFRAVVRLCLVLVSVFIPLVGSKLFGWDLDVYSVMTSALLVSSTPSSCSILARAIVQTSTTGLADVEGIFFAADGGVSEVRQR